MAAPPGCRCLATACCCPCRHAILISSEREAALGKQTYRQVLEEAKAAGMLLPPNHPATRLVRRVGTLVAKVGCCSLLHGDARCLPCSASNASPYTCLFFAAGPRQAATDGYGGGFQDHLRSLDWDFAVVDSSQVNAFVVPGGKVVVYTGGQCACVSRWMGGRVGGHTSAMADILLVCQTNRWPQAACRPLRRSRPAAPRQPSYALPRSSWMPYGLAANSPQPPYSPPCPSPSHPFRPAAHGVQRSRAGGGAGP